jgi:hypothetical protein
VMKPSGKSFGRTPSKCLGCDRLWPRLLCYDGRSPTSTLYEPLRRDSRREWVAGFAPDFFRSGEADESKNAFAERREPDFSKYPRTAGVYTPSKS